LFPSPFYQFPQAFLSPLLIQGHVYDPVYPENVACDLKLEDVILSDPEPKPIPVLIYNGTYSCNATKPKVALQPQETVAKKVPLQFDVEVNVTTIVNLYAFAWICIKSKKEKIGFGRTASFLLPPKIEELIKLGRELGEADDIFFDIKNSKQKMGAIGLLSKSKLDRKKLYEQGVICALIPFLNKKLY